MASSTLFTQAESKTLDAIALSSKLSESAERAATYLESKLQSNGSYGSEAKDIACYFKSPMMYLAANKPGAALATLNYIKSAFMTSDGDFKTSSSVKSVNGAYIEYWSYTNGWIIRAANQLGITSISEPATKYLSQYYMGKEIGFVTNELSILPQMTDVLTIAHHALISLEKNNLEIAIPAGQFLCDVLKKQPNLKKGFYLRVDKERCLLTDFPETKKPFYYISSSEPNQLHFMIGYPAAYLAILYKKTQNIDFLDAAKSYLDFSLSCDKSVYACDFSHKLAWAASLIYECTGDVKYLEVINRISNYFIEKQDQALWFSDDINNSYDQSAEIACWFLDIVKNINAFNKNPSLEAGLTNTPASPFSSK